MASHRRIPHARDLRFRIKHGANRVIVRQDRTAERCPNLLVRKVLLDHASQCRIIASMPQTTTPSETKPLEAEKPLQKTAATTERPRFKVPARSFSLFWLAVPCL